MSTELFDNSPTTNEEREAGILDWADSITQVQRHSRILSDSLATKDAERTRNSALALLNFTNELARYLEARGVLKEAESEEGNDAADIGNT